MNEPAPPFMTPVPSQPSTGDGTSAASGSMPIHSVAYAPVVKRPSWPLVFGIISIVLGCICTLYYSLSSVFSLLATLLGTMGPGIQGAEFTWVLALGMTSNVILAATYGLLIPAGILLLKRRATGATLHRLWSWLKLLVELAAGIVTFASVQWLALRSSSSGGTSPPMFTSWILLATIAVSLLWGAVYPVVLLLFLRRKAAKAEIARWRTEQATAATGMASAILPLPE